MVLVIASVNTVSNSKYSDRRSLRKQLRAPQGANSNATTNSILCKIKLSATLKYYAILLYIFKPFYKDIPIIS
jgi:hypothetical protein